MDPKPSSRIVNWLRDFDPHMRIRWSRVLGAFSIERKARISDRLRDEVQLRCNLAFNPHETDSEHYDRIMNLRRMAHCRLEAIREGYDTVCSIPESTPTEEAELIEFLREKDPWRFGHPDQKGADFVATQLANAARDKELAASKATEASVEKEIAARSKDAATSYWIRTRQQVGHGRGTTRAAEDAKREGKAA